MVIQNNIPGLNSKRNYNKNSSKLAKSLEKLSSGYAINRAADDAAGLAVSEKMRSQICGIKQSVKNCQDGISLIQTFEGALGETVAIIKRMKSLADQSANGTYDDNVDRNAIEIEYLHLCDEVNHIAETDFNGVVMLNGKPDSMARAAEFERAVNSAVKESLNSLSPASSYADVLQTASFSDVSVQAAAFAAPRAGGTVCGDFTVYGDSSDFSFDTATGVLTILGGNVTVEGTGAPTTNTIVVAKDKSANVTLKNVNIDVSGTDDACAFKIEDGSNITLILDGDNILQSGNNCGAIQKRGASSSGLLTVTGNGYLNMISGKNDPYSYTERFILDGNRTIVESNRQLEFICKNGIYIEGSLNSNYKSANVYGDVEIARDVILNCNELNVISGNTLTVAQGATLTTTHNVENYGTIFNNGTLIHSGIDNNCGIIISGANSQILTTKPSYKITGVQPLKLSQSGLGFNVHGGINGTDYTYKNGILTILTNKEMTISGVKGNITSDRINIAKDINANITLDNVCINVNDLDGDVCALKIADNSKGNVKITLQGENILRSSGGCAGLQKNGGIETGTLTINGDGSLYVIGSKGQGAAIGGADGKDGSNIIIESGTIKAINEILVGRGYVGCCGAGIGGGRNADGNNITINGGNIYAYSNRGAGIGGGGIDGLIRIAGNGNNITITGGEIFAYGGTGIGGGENGNGTNIVISGGKVISLADKGAGIGGGKLGKGIITIEGCDTIVLAGQYRGAKNDTIGSGENGAPKEVSIKDGLIKEAEEFAFYDEFANLYREMKNVIIVHYVPGAIQDPNDPDYDNNKQDENNKPNIPDPDNPNSSDNPAKLIVSIPNAYGNASAKLTYTDNLFLQTGARTKDAVNFTFAYSTNGIGGLAADLNCTAKGLGINTLTLKTQESANYAIDKLDHALNKVSMIRATFGAAQNRLEHKIDNLNNTTENLTAAESAIRDTDMAKEMMNFTKNQILTQASQSMLAQANSLPQQVMSLISS